jgi:osmotically-inducible protein OsmY
MINLFKSVIVLIMVMVIMNYTNARAEDAGMTHDASVIKQSVIDALVADPVTNKLDITVKVYYGGVVLLSGFADTPEQVDRAGEIATGVEGVKEVSNLLTSLRHRNGSDGYQGYTDD